MTFVTSTLDILVDSFAVSFVVVPLTVVYIAISVVEHALTLRMIEVPCALVARPIWPFHRALAVTHTAEPIASVNSTALVGILTHLDSLIIGVEISLERFLPLLLLEVLDAYLVIKFEDTILASFEESSNN